MIAAQCAAGSLALRCARSSVVRENCAALLRGLVFVFEYHSVGSI